MQHFIWVFTVHKRTYLGVSHTQRVNQFARDHVKEVQENLYSKIISISKTTKANFSLIIFMFKLYDVMQAGLCCQDGTIISDSDSQTL